MYTIDFQKPIHVHFIGIGGISMSGLAEILLNRHFTVTGSDMQASDMTKHLEETGARLLSDRKQRILPMISILLFILLPFTNLTKNLLLQRIKESL